MTLRFVDQWKAQKVSRDKRRTKKIWVRNLYHRLEYEVVSIAVILRWENGKYSTKLAGSSWRELDTLNTREAKQQAEALAIAMRRLS